MSLVGLQISYGRQYLLSIKGEIWNLIELLVVISIIAILAGMLIPTVQILMARARQTACANNQKQIILGMLTYAQDVHSWGPVNFQIPITVP